MRAKNKIQTGNCSACGSSAERRFAKYCRVCGKSLREDYQPLDSLRSSYRMQGKSIAAENIGVRSAEKLFDVNENSVSQTAWACFVYSLVPYIGIIFVPWTILFGGMSLFVLHKNPNLGGGKLTLVSLLLSGLVLAVQLVLWWLLFYIPTLSS